MPDGNDAIVAIARVQAPPPRSFYRLPVFLNGSEHAHVTTSPDTRARARAAPPQPAVRHNMVFPKSQPVHRPSSSTKGQTVKAQRRHGRFKFEITLYGFVDFIGRNRRSKQHEPNDIDTCSSSMFLSVSSNDQLIHREFKISRYMRDTCDDVRKK